MVRSTCLPALALLAGGFLAGCSGVNPPTTAAATARLADHPRAEVGRPAPEIKGADADGTAFQLSEFKGQVVLLNFWHSSWRPCREFLPHERSLVSLYKGRPFALLGVNLDPRREDLKQMTDSGQVTWRCWWEDPAGPGELLEAWQVEGFPTLYLIDHKGVVRHVFLGVPKLPVLEGKIEELVRKAEEAAKAS